jgi:hypothetical protein
VSGNTWSLIPQMVSSTYTFVLRRACTNEEKHSLVQRIWGNNTLISKVKKFQRTPVVSFAVLSNIGTDRYEYPSYTACIPIALVNPQSYPSRCSPPSRYPLIPPADPYNISTQSAPHLKRATHHDRHLQVSQSKLPSIPPATAEVSKFACWLSISLMVCATRC